MRASSSFIELDEFIASEIKDAEKGIIQNNKELYRKLKSKLDEVYEKYAVDGKLSYDDMRRYKRADKLIADISTEITKTSKLNDRLIYRLLKMTASNAITNSLSILGEDNRIKAIKKAIDVEHIINDTVGGRNWQERTRHHNANLVYDVITEVKKGINSGTSYHDMARAIKKKMGSYNGRPLTIAKTETHRITETIKNDAMGEIAKELPMLKTWHSMGDGAVRDSHRKMDGQTVKMDEPFILPSGKKTMYPGQSGEAKEDINCRCFVSYEVDEKELQRQKTLENHGEKGYNINEQEESNKGKDKNFRINSKLIDSNEYDKKFAQIDEDKNIQRILKQSAREILHHRDGQEFEDLYFIDSENGNTLKSIFYEKERKAKTTKAMMKMIKKAEPNTIIAVHNHPGSLPPSENDLVACNQRKHKYGIIPCHDGTIWKYETSDNISFIKYNVAYDKFKRSNYTKIKEFIKEAESGGVKLWKI